MRNVCGHIKPSLNNILALDSFVGLKEIMIIHHTGMMYHAFGFLAAANRMARLRFYSFHR